MVSYKKVLEEFINDLIGIGSDNLTLVLCKELMLKYELFGKKERYNNILGINQTLLSRDCILE